MHIGPDGYLYVVRNDPEQPLVIQYDLANSMWAPKVRGTGVLTAPTGLAIMPPSPDDCNRNWTPDSCDIVSGFSADADHNGVPDECEIYDRDEDGIPDSLDNCPDLASPILTDSDGDGYGDPCDACDGSDDAYDSDRDGVPDGCDVCDRYADSFDADGDGTPDGCDRCPDFDDSFDADGDGVPDDCDVCPGFDDNDDVDHDQVPDGCDPCLGCEFTVVLDSVVGLHGPDTVIGNTPLEFHFRLRTNVPGKRLSAFSHSFVLYSPDSAEWFPPSVDSAAIDWFTQFQGQEPVFQFGTRSADGSGRDTVIIKAESSESSYVLNEAFDEIAFMTSTRVHNSEAGKTLCLDSSQYVWHWIWYGLPYSQLSPIWLGPRCFSIVAGPCCEGITGNVDGDPEDVVDIGDLTALISYLYIPPNSAPNCLAEANMDGDAQSLIDIGDLTSLVDYLYISGNLPADCP
jgi:hypothetical protein